MIDCICCEAAIDELYKLPCKIDEDGYRWVLSRDVAHMIDSIPDADVVARDCYDRILTENDTMREQLAQIGKKPGDSMDDVRPVVRGHYVGEYDGYADGNPVYDMWYCSECGCCFEDWDEKPTYNFCPNCGADMRPEQPEEGGGEDG